MFESILELRELRNFYVCVSQELESLLEAEQEKSAGLAAIAEEAIAQAENATGQVHIAYLSFLPFLFLFVTSSCAPPSLQTSPFAKKLAERRASMAVLVDH